MKEMPVPRLYRRRGILLAMLGFSIIGIPVERWRRADMTTSNDRDRLALQILDRLGVCAAAVRPLGIEHLASMRDAIATDVLVNRIAAALHESVQDLAGGKTTKIQAQFRRALRADFIEGRTVVRQGWLLSTLEADTFALAVLLND